MDFDEVLILQFRAYDRAAVKFRGIDADINFTISDYEDDFKQVILNSNRDQSLLLVA